MVAACSLALGVAAPAVALAQPGAQPPAGDQTSSGQASSGQAPSGETSSGTSSDLPSAGQAPSGGSPSGHVQAAQPAPGLQVWTTYQGAALAWLKGQAAAYGQQFDKQVEITSMKLGDIKQRALVEADKGKAADLFVGVPHDQFSALADAGVLADMGNYATGRYLASLSAQAARAFRYQGTLYGLPLSVQGPALIVNSDLVPTVPSTYAQLKKVAASLTGGGQYGFAVDAGNFYYAYGWLRTFGGYVFGTDAQGNADPTDLGLASAGSVAGLEELKALRFQDGLLPPDSSYAALRKLFVTGKLAMIYDGPWAIPAIARAKIPVVVAPMPPLADGTPWHGLMNVDGVLVNHYSTDRVGAANLAKWLTQVDAQAALARQAGSIPASPQALARVHSDAIIHGFGEALQDAVAIPNVPAMGTVWGPMDDALGSILASPGSDVKAILARAAATIGNP